MKRPDVARRNAARAHGYDEAEVYVPVPHVPVDIPATLPPHPNGTPWPMLTEVW